MVSVVSEGPRKRSQRKRARMRPLVRNWEREDLRKEVVRMGGASGLRFER